MNKLNLLNSPLEVSLRIILLLVRLKDTSLSIDEIVLLDYFIVHLKDFNCNLESIHPELPNRENELLVKRQKVIEAIKILENHSLIKVNYTKTGIKYSASFLATEVNKKLDSSYAQRLNTNVNLITLDNLGEIFISVESLVKKNNNLWVNELL